MAKRRGFTEFGNDPFEVAINNVAQQINTFMPKGIGGGQAPKPIPQSKSNVMNRSVKMYGPRSFMDAAWGGESGEGKQLAAIPMNRRGFDQLPSVQPRVGMSGAGAFQTKASNDFWGTTVGDYNTTERMGRQYLEEQAKAKAAQYDSSVTGGNSGNANPDRIAGALKHKDLMMRVSEESGVPWQVLAATMALETGGKNEGTNPAGATGLMQVVGHYASGEPLWQSLADQYGGDLMDPYTNVRTAAEIMKMGYDTYGSWEKAAAWYFGGGGAFNDDGSYSINADMYGTDIPTYVNIWKDNFAAVSGSGSGAAPNSGDALARAESTIGMPYILGAESFEENGFDCSGLVVFAYGNRVPVRTAHEQFYGTQRINEDQLQKGDLMFFDWEGDGYIDHVGISWGNGQMLHAPKEGDTVRVVDVNNDFWRRHTVGYTRVP